MDVQRMKDELLLRGIDPSKPAFVYPSAGRRPEELNVSRGVNAPLQAARGWAAGLLGLPGDVEGLLRQGVNFAFGPGGVNVSPTPALPTSDFYREYLPGYDPQPFARAVSGAGALTGGMGATGVARGAMKAGQAAGQALGPKAAQMAESYLQSTGLAPAVVKPKGGNWLEKSIERATDVVRPTAGVRDLPVGDVVRELERTYPPDILAQANPGLRSYVEFTKEQLKPDLAVDNWINQKLNKYIRNELGTPEDPVRELAERGITHMPGLGQHVQVPTSLTKLQRQAGGFPEEGMGKSLLARNWEQKADEAIRSGRVDEYTEPRLWLDNSMRSKLVENPWLKDLPPNQKVYEPASTAEPFERKLGLDQLIDELRNIVKTESDLPQRLRWKPEDLSKVTMEQAVKRVAEVNKYRADQKLAEWQAVRKDLPVYKQYPEKYRWVELDRPGAFSAEADAMGHSVRGYEPPPGHPDWIPQSGDQGHPGYGMGGWEAIKEGRAKVYSLVDEQGKPHITVETASVDPEMAITMMDPAQRTSLIQKVKDDYFGGRTPNMNEQDKYFDKLHETYIRLYGEPKPEVYQIKGKGNAPPNPKYLPYAQDFVQKGEWSAVNNLDDLAGIEMIEISPGSDLAKQISKAGKKAPKYVTQDQLTDLLKWSRNEGEMPKFAKGGRVPTMDQMRLALMDKKSMKDGGAVDDDYRGEHRAPGPTSGKPMHDLKDVYPDDFYGPNGFRYYADTGAEYDRPSYVTARMAKGKPDQKVWIHRAIPTDVYKKALSTQAPLQQMIRPGDWVTLSKQYAREHGEARLKGDYKIASKQVPASHLYTNGDSINEWGYHPTSRMDKE